MEIEIPFGANDSELINWECTIPEGCFAEIKNGKVIIKRLKPELTPFEQALNELVSEEGGAFMSVQYTKEKAVTLLALARKELLSHADESNPAIEATANLERAVTCGGYIPKWLEAEFNKRYFSGYNKGVEEGRRMEREESHENYVRGYANGYKDAEEQYNESVAYHFPTMPTTPVFGCDGIHCTNPQMDCINCPRRTTGGSFSTNTSSGTSTATLHGNTSFTDGKEHNPSFTD